MATATQATRETVRAYHEAWTGPDVWSAGEYIADDFMTRAPVGSYDTKDEYLAGLANFRNQFVTGVDLISEFKLTGGRISFTNLVFDATAWRAMMATQGKTVDGEGHVIDL